MQRSTWTVIALAYLAFAEVLSWTPVPDLSLCLIQPEQVSNHDDKKYCPAFHSGGALVFEKVDSFLEHHDKSVVGAFTIILAVSTIGLWLATNNLWKAGGDQLAQIKRSADISERALTELEAPFTAIKIIETGLTKKTVEIGHDFGRLQFSITNNGRTPARLVELVDKTMLIPIGAGNPSPINLNFRSRNTMPYGVISPPNSESQPFSQNLMLNHMNELAADPIPLKKNALFFYGFIRYETIFKQTYRMGFCYMFDKFSEGWILTGEENYNYLTKESEIPVAFAS